MALKVGELFASLTLDSKDFDKGLGKTESKFGGMAKAVGGMAVTMLAGLTTAMAGATTAVLGFGTKFNATMEQSAIAWETLLGGADEAKKMIEDLQKLGAKTPFEFEGLDKSAKLLHMAKFEGEDLTKALVSVGDAVSAIGGDAETMEGISMALFQMQAKTKVQAEEMLQMAERGLPVWDILAEKMGKSTAELMDMASKGELLAKDVVPLLVDGLGDKFGGAMDKQSKSFNGMVSTIKDNVSMLVADMSKPFFDFAKKILPQVIQGIDSLSEAFKRGGFKGMIKEILPEGVYNFLVSAFETIKQTVVNLAPVITSLASQWWENFQRIGEIVKTVIDAVVPLFMEGVSMIVEWWKTNGSELMENVRIVFDGIFAVIQFIMPAVLAVVTMIWDNVKGVISGALNIISGVFSIFAGLFTGDWSKMWDGVKQLLGGAIEFIWNLWNLMLVGKLLAGIKALGTKALGSFKGMWTNIQNGFGSFVSWIQGLVGKLVSGAVSGFTNLSTRASQIFTAFRNIGFSIFNSIKQTIYNIVLDLVNIVVTRFNVLRTNVSNVFNGIKSVATSIFNGVKSAITNPITSAKNTILGIINTIKSAFSKMKINIPKPRLPKINVGSKNVLGVPIPTFSVDWFKTGGIATGPSIAGIGEAGSEAIVPLAGRRMLPFSQSIAKQLSEMIGDFGGGGDYSNRPIVVKIGEREIIKAIGEPMNRSLGEKQTFTRRANGKGTS